MKIYRKHYSESVSIKQHGLPERQHCLFTRDTPTGFENRYIKMSHYSKMFSLCQLSKFVQKVKMLPLQQWQRKIFTQTRAGLKNYQHLIFFIVIYRVSLTSDQLKD